VGDGANDVSMIQEAKVGIGIMGLEGSQAELASDYAIPKFRFLRRLLTQHGRYDWYRNASCVLYSFYKNVALSICLVLYTFYSGFSGQTIFDSWLLGIFNAFFCSLVPVTVGALDRDVDPEIVDATPALFGPLQREQRHFNARAIFRFTLDAFAHGLLAYWVVHVYADKDDLDMAAAGLTHYGTTMFVLLVVFVDTAGAWLVRRWDVVQVVSVGAQYFLLLVLLLAYSYLPRGIDSTTFVNVLPEVLSDEKIYLWAMVLMLGAFAVLCVARDYFLETEMPTEIEVAAATWCPPMPVTPRDPVPSANVSGNLASRAEFSSSF